MWLTGWGTVLLLAWRTDSLFEFIRNPKFMISDFLLLPACGFLVTRFYQSVEKPAASVASAKVGYVSLPLATIATILATMYSVLVSNNFGGVWSVPLMLFFGFFTYVLTGFFVRGVLQLRVRSTPSLWFYQTGVVAAIGGHAVFGILWG